MLFHFHNIPAFVLILPPFDKGGFGFIIFYYKNMVRSNKKTRGNPLVLYVVNFFNYGLVGVPVKPVVTVA